ncbi:hypothetical protein V8E51_012169 [Hyaloscypha variabilis]
MLTNGGSSPYSVSSVKLHQRLSAVFAYTSTFRWKTLFEAKSLAAKGVDGPAYDFKAPYDTEPSTTESTGDTDIEPGPLITQAKAAHEAMLKQKAPNALAPAGSSAPDKKNASANENSEEKPKTTKRKANPKNNLASSKKSSQDQSTKAQVEVADEVAFTGFKLSRIMAKGWQTPAGASKSCWCYAVEWEEHAATNTEAGDTTWEPVSSMKKDQPLMVELFEARMLEESRNGPPTWTDVKAQIDAQVEDELAEPLDHKKSYKKKKKVA